MSNVAQLKLQQIADIWWAQAVMISEIEPWRRADVVRCIEYYMAAARESRS